MITIITTNITITSVVSSSLLLLLLLFLVSGEKRAQGVGEAAEAGQQSKRRRNLDAVGAGAGAERRHQTELRVVWGEECRQAPAARSERLRTNQCDGREVATPQISSNRC